MKNILITGASGGIGSEIARKFATLGFRVLMVYNKNKAAIDKLSDELSLVTEVAVYQCNLAEERAVKAMVADIIKRFKRIDCLVNCAGVAQIKQIQDVTEKDFDFVFDNNVKSTFFVLKYVVPHMVSEKAGGIVNISSMWGKVGASMESIYSASKGAINSLTLSLAKELGPSGITVNAICPGLIDTKMNANLSAADKKEIIAATPLNRIGTPQDVANAVEYLLSAKASFVTGQILTIDGGLTL